MQEDKLKLAQLIQDELRWDKTFQQNQEKLSQLAKEAQTDFEKDNVSDKDW